MHPFCSSKPDLTHKTKVTETSSVLTVNPTNTTFNSTKYLWIDTATAAYEPVAFASSTSTTGYTDSGMVFYGSIAMWEPTDGLFEAVFYATPTTTKGTYILKWNEASIDDGVSTAVVVKKTAPVST